jgi:hypothetical protein
VPNHFPPGSGCLNFEDFIALHLDSQQFAEWLSFGGKGHFTDPLHSRDYLPEFQKIFPDYGKGALSVNFRNWKSLSNLKRDMAHRPRTNPHNLSGIRCFVEFLVINIESAYPGSLS